MKLSLFILLSLSMLVLTACETTETPDGMVPASYLASAQNAVGHYVGSFSRDVYFDQHGLKDSISHENLGKDITIDIALLDSRPMIQSNFDWTGEPSCGAQVKSLWGVRTFNENHALTFFHLDSGSCSLEVESKFLYLWIEKLRDGTIELRSQVRLSSRKSGYGRYSGEVITKISGKFKKSATAAAK